MDCSSKNRKDTTREQEKQVNYLSMINIFSKREQQDGNIAMAWVDYEKAYNVGPQSWIINCLKMYKISDKVRKFILKSMKNWWVQLIAVGKSLAKVKIQRYFLRRYAITITIYDIDNATQSLRKCTGGCKLTKAQKINQLMYRTDMKLLAKWIYSQDIDIENLA